MQQLHLVCLWADRDWKGKSDVEIIKLCISTYIHLLTFPFRKKTHTLFGPPNAFHGRSLEDHHANEQFKGTLIPSTWGVFPRLVLELLTSGPSVTATAVEIYMDNCYDLMRENKPKIAIAGFGKSSKISGKGLIDCRSIQRDKMGKWVPPPTVVERPKMDRYELRGAKPLLITNVQVRQYRNHYFILELSTDPLRHYFVRCRNYWTSCAL